MRVYGNARTGGSMEQQPVPFPVDPTIQYTRPTPPTREPKARPVVEGRNGRNKPITSSERDAILTMWADGDPATRIALRLGCSPTTVWKIVADARKTA